MYETITVVGERGQITIPKIIRELEQISAKVRAILKVENERVLVV